MTTRAHKFTRDPFLGHVRPECENCGSDNSGSECPAALQVNDRVRVAEQVGGILNGELVMVPAGTEGVIVETDPIVVVVDTPRGEFDMTRIPNLVPQQVERI